ncbi:MAG: ATP-binding protein [Thermotogota bacterium]
MTNKNLDKLAQHLIELLPKLKEDKSQMAQEFYQTAEAYIHTSRQLYKIIEISDKNQSAIMDMSKELKRSQEQLKQAKETAERANRSKSTFLSNMSHEIRTPLNSIIGFTDLLVNLPMDEMQKQYVKNINISAHSLLGIINDILDFSKIEAGKLELELTKENIVKLAEEAMNIIKFQAQKKGLNLALDVPPDMPRFASIDGVRLRQVMVNLLGNAVKFTEKGEVKLKLSLTRIDEKRGLYHISVEDTGIGITDDKKDKLFKSFSQADVSISRKFGGTGLGLAISAMLVDKMGSTLEVKSELGKGSTFFFSIETEYFYEDDKPEINRKVKTDDEQSDTMLKSTIMIAEDVNINMQLIKAIITKYFSDVKILEAQNGEEACALARNNEIDLILMDIQMPVMDGLVATKKIREEETKTGKHIPIIALTAAAVKEDIQNCLDAGMDDYFTKPIKQKRFHEKLQHYLNQQREKQKDTRNKGRVSKEIEEVNFEEGVKRLNQKKELYLDLLQEFSAQSTEEFQALKNALQHQQSEATAIAHRIKGLAYNLSVNEVGQAAEEIEIALKKGDSESLDSKVEILREKITNFKTSLEQYLSK